MMKLPVQTFTLPDGRTLTLRSPVPADAATLLAFLKDTCGETPFLLPYPEEVSRSIPQEESWIQTKLDQNRGYSLFAFDGDRAVASTSLDPLSQRHAKLSHRVQMGIAIRKGYWHGGLGRRLMAENIKWAKELGYRQLELSTFSDNDRAIRLYESFGFTVCGRIPNAFRLKDGTFRDDVLMVADLS